MYNNEVTYHKKWETPENQAILEKLDRKYFDKSICYPSCPPAWAPEILELLNLFDKELGIAYNTSTLRSYYPQGNWISWFITSPAKNFWYSLKNVFKYEEHSKKTIIDKVVNILPSTFRSYGYGYRCIRVKYINPILNNIFKPKFQLDQIKEKYGHLTIYYTCPPAFEEWVDREIRKVELKLALKGAYYPIESFWDSASSRNVNNEYHPDTVEVEKGINSYDGKPYTSVTKTMYRGLMKELGLNLQDVEMKAMMAASKREKFP